MDNITLDNITIEDLKERIDYLREILNEMCCEEQNMEVKEQSLIVSRYLDELIVKYMRRLGN
ncbi:Spo0E family sporulation regulatory protein-aspartic acid phosphatase [Clostridium sp.]|uniref:Spo0E family sporulation regulatory protein-aspartic acid phosphatase n=1 Tax=Clostridium sp. TaxID=1506 RepID=UPI003D6CAC20